MNVKTDPVPPVPRHTPPVDDKSLLKTFAINWQQWFEQLREKVNILNSSLVTLAEVTGTGLLVKDGASWNLRVISPGSSYVTVSNADGASGNPEIDLSTPTKNSLAAADSAIQAGDNVSLLTNDAGYLTSLGTYTLKDESGVSYSFASTDAGKVVSKLSGANTSTYSIETGTFQAGNWIMGYNLMSGQDLVISPDVGVTLYLAGTGTTGSVTVGSFGKYFMYFTSANEAVIDGLNVS